MKYYMISFLVMMHVGLLVGGSKKSVPKVAITYAFSGGHFGDNLLAYMHTKWLSYKYGILVFYRPFDYSEELVFSSREMRPKNVAETYVKIHLKNEKQLTIKCKKKTLFEVPYFPESPQELKTQSWAYFKVDWNDQKFIALLKNAIHPKKPLLTLLLPAEAISVALHVRRGGSFEQAIEGFPAKFPHDEYYIEALDLLYTMLGGQKLYVFIFTDDQHPDYVAAMFRESFKNKNIVFDYRREENDHNLHVLEDFFALTQFDCLIRPDSNFSLCAAKLKNFLVEIAPEDCLLSGSGGISSVASLSITADSNLAGFFGKDVIEVERQGARLRCVVPVDRKKGCA